MSVLCPHQIASFQPLSRRRFLGLGATATLTAFLSERSFGDELSPPNLSESIPRSGRAVDGTRRDYARAADPELTEFTDLLAWLINTSFDLSGDRRFPNRPAEAEIARVRRAAPTEDEDFARAADRAFHESFSSPFEVGKAYPYEQTRFGFYLGIDRYVRASRQKAVPRIKDLSARELRRLRYRFDRSVERARDGVDGAEPVVYFPCGPRRRYTPADYRRFEEACGNCAVIDKSGVRRAGKPEDFILEYCRPFNDGEQPHTSFGVRRRQSPELEDLLIPASPDPA